MLDDPLTDTPAPLPPTRKQLDYARKLALRNQALLPWEIQQDRHTLSSWISAQVAQPAVNNQRPSSKQVAYAERLARIRRRDVPDECFQSRDLMSRWIDCNRV